MNSETSIFIPIIIGLFPFVCILFAILIEALDKYESSILESIMEEISNLFNWKEQRKQQEYIRRDEILDEVQRFVNEIDKRNL